MAITSQVSTASDSQDSSLINGDNQKPVKTSPIKGRPTNAKDALLHWCYMKTKSYVSS